MIDRPKPWDLIKLDAYVEATLTRMAENRDVMSFANGEPDYVVRAAGTRASGKLRLDMNVNMSGIGMPTNAPVTVLMDPHAGPISWFLGDQLIATTDRHQEPQQVADATLTMDILLDAHRKWVIRSGTGQRSR